MSRRVVWASTQDSGDVAIIANGDGTYTVNVNTDDDGSSEVVIDVDDLRRMHTDVTIELAR